MATEDVGAYKNITSIVGSRQRSKVMAIKYDREGKMLAVAALDGSINVWSMDENGKFTEVALLKASTTTPTTCSTISWDPVNDSRLASIYGDGQLRIWDIKKAACLFTTGMSSRPLLSLSWSPDGKYIAVSDKDDLLSFVETANKFKVCRRMKFEYFIFEMLWTKDSSHFLIANGNNAKTGGEVEVYKMVPEEKSLVTKVFVALGHTAHCNTFTMNKERSVLVTGGLDALVCIWDVSDMVCHTTISRFKYPVRAVAINHDSTLLASICSFPDKLPNGDPLPLSEKYIDIADLRTGVQIAEISIAEFTFPLMTIQFSPVANTLAFTIDEKESAYMKHEGAIKFLTFKTGKKTTEDSKSKRLPGEYHDF